MSKPYTVRKRKAGWIPLGVPSRGHSVQAAHHEAELSIKLTLEKFCFLNWWPSNALYITSPQSTEEGQKVHPLLVVRRETLWGIL